MTDHLHHAHLRGMTPQRLLAGCLECTGNDDGMLKTLYSQATVRGVQEMEAPMRFISRLWG